MNNISKLMDGKETILLSEEHIPLKYNIIKSYLLFTEEFEKIKKDVEDFNNMVCNKDEIEVELVPAILKLKYIRK